MRQKIDLNGLWKFRTDPNNTGELYPEDVMSVRRHETRFMDPEYRDEAWEMISVPAHWQTQGHMYNGTAWYRRTFKIDGDMPGKSVMLRFKGVDYYCDLWVNGFYFGSHAGYFTPFSYDITRRVKPGINSITVKVESPNDTNLLNLHQRDKKLVKGALQDWDANNMDINPGGMWNCVYIDILPAQYMENIKVGSFLKDQYRRADVIMDLQAVNADKTIKQAEYIVEIIPVNFAGEKLCFSSKTTLMPGENKHTMVCTVHEPALWWTWDTGEQNLYNINVHLKAEDELLDEMTVTTGIREIRREKGWETYLNGRRIFFKGGSYLSDQLLSTMNYERYKEDIKLAKDANMNVLRLFCLVEKEEFYQICDEEGIMLYQEFPIQWSMSDSSEFVRHALPQVGDMINLLYNHPSIVIWCFGSEPGKKNFAKLCAALVHKAEKLDATRIVQHSNSWKDAWGFDEYVQKFGWAVDNHFYPGWFPGVWEDVFDLYDMKPEHLEMVTEFGSQGLPCLESIKKMMAPEAIWPPNWNEYSYRCFFKQQTMFWFDEPSGIEDFIEKTQERQSFVLKFIIEFLRCRKFNKCNGAILFLFNDCWPSLTWSIIDYYRKPKKAYFTVQMAFDPILIAMDWPRADMLEKGARSKIYVVNDTNKSFGELKVKYRIEDAFGTAKCEKELHANIKANDLYASEELLLEMDGMGDTIILELLDKSGVIRSNTYKPACLHTKDVEKEKGSINMQEI